MSKAWLKDLEERVHQACEQLSGMRAENADLRGKLAASADRVAELEGQNADLAAAGASSGEDATAWEAEREEVRTRVSSLVDQLAGLLDEGRRDEA